jgi:hypothetical protein
METNIQIGKQLSESDASLYELGSMRSFKNYEGYTIYFADQYIEISKDGKIVTTFTPGEGEDDDIDDSTKNIQIGKKLQEGELAGIVVFFSAVPEFDEVDITVREKGGKLIAGGIDSVWTRKYRSKEELKAKMVEIALNNPGAMVVATDRSSGDVIARVKIPVKESKVNEAEKEVKEWEGDFANFNSKIFSACKDLDLSPDKFEQVILDLQNAEAIGLNRDKVCLDLIKTRKVFIELLTGQVQSAEDQSQAVSDLHEPPPKAPDLGNAPSAAAPIESISEGDEKKDDVESRVDMILKKYFV